MAGAGTIAVQAAPQVDVGVLVVREGLVLLRRRKGSHGAGTWSAPGGKLDFGEELEDCARRELLEETGLGASHIELGPYSNDVFASAGRHFLGHLLQTGCCRSDWDGKCQRRPIPDVGQFIGRLSAVRPNLTVDGGEACCRVRESATVFGQRPLRLASNWRCQPVAAVRACPKLPHG